MKEFISLALLVVGSSFAAMGVVTYVSASTTMYQLLPVTPNDNPAYMLIGGGIAAVLGLVGLLRISKAL